MTSFMKVDDFGRVVYGRRRRVSLRTSSEISSENVYPILLNINIFFGIVL